MKTITLTENQFNNIFEKITCKYGSVFHWMKSDDKLSEWEQSRLPKILREINHDLALLKERIEKA